jgi:hypothetical protein
MRLISRSERVLLFASLLLTLLAIGHDKAMAQYSFELTPSISLGTQYDDNINSGTTDKESDLVTTISPSIGLDILSEQSLLSLSYSPTIVRYQREDQNNSLRHEGRLAISQGLTRKLNLNFTDSFLVSEDPIEGSGSTISVRDSRNQYQRNTASGSLDYLFGLEDRATIGYRLALLKNEDDSLEDSRTKTCFADMSYWFGGNNGIEFDCQYTSADFSSGETGFISGTTIPDPDSYSDHAATLQFNHRFSPHSALGFYCGLTRHFEGPSGVSMVSGDYDVREGGISIIQRYLHDLSLDVRIGYFTREAAQDRDKNLSYSARLEKGFERGNITIGGNSGWAEAHMEAERRGFIQYYGMDASLSYRIMERLALNAAISYRKENWQDQDTVDREWETLGADYSLAWTFQRWYSLSLSYAHLGRNDKDDIEDYNNNRVTLTFSAARPFVW